MLPQKSYAIDRFRQALLLLCCGLPLLTSCNTRVGHALGLGASCEPMQDFRVEGFCDMVQTVAWDGSSCRYWSGCTCEGKDCHAYADMEDCISAHAYCPRAQ